MKQAGGRAGRCTRRAWLWAAVLVAAGGGTSWPADPVAEGGARADRFQVLSWNIHHGEGLDGRVDLARIAALIRKSGADLVALQEVDRGVARTDRIDMPAVLARLTGMRVCFVNNYAFQGGEYGNAILTRLPLVDSTNTHFRMLRSGEQRGLLQATVRLPSGRCLGFWSTHLDYRRDPAERLANVAQIRERLAAYPGLPVVLAGDFNDFPETEVWRRLDLDWRDVWREVGRGEGWTFSSDRPRSRIDFVWVRRGVDAPRAVRAGVLESQASDHLPLWVQFRWP